MYIDAKNGQQEGSGQFDDTIQKVRNWFSNNDNFQLPSFDNIKDKLGNLDKNYQQYKPNLNDKYDELIKTLEKISSKSPQSVQDVKQNLTKLYQNLKNNDILDRKTIQQYIPESMPSNMDLNEWFENIRQTIKDKVIPLVKRQKELYNELSEKLQNESVDVNSIVAFARDQGLLNKNTEEIIKQYVDHINEVGKKLTNSNNFTFGGNDGFGYDSNSRNSGSNSGSSGRDSNGRNSRSNNGSSGYDSNGRNSGSNNGSFGYDSNSRNSRSNNGSFGYDSNSRNSGSNNGSFGYDSNSRNSGSNSGNSRYDGNYGFNNGSSGYNGNSGSNRSNTSNGNSGYGRNSGST